MFQSWAVRNEVSVRCGMLAQNGYLPTHTAALKATSLRYQKSSMSDMMFADYCAEQTFAPPSEEVYESIAVQTKHSLSNALSHLCGPHGSVELAPSGKRALLELAQNENLQITRLLCDVFWSVIASLHSTRALEPLKGATIKTLDPARKGMVPPQLLATTRDLEEIFAAACASRSDTLDYETLTRLLTRLQLLIDGTVVEALLDDIRLEGNPLSYQPPAARSRQSPVPPALARPLSGSERELSTGFMRNSFEMSRTSSSARNHKSITSRGVSPHDDGGEDVANTPHSAFSQSARNAATSSRVLKSEFIRWARVQKLSELGAAKLQQAGSLYALRASKKFRHLLSPFRYSLAIRDAIELPLVMLLASVLVSWIRSAVVIPDDGPFGASVAGSNLELHTHIERLVSKMLLGIAVNGGTGAREDLSHSNTTVTLRDEMSVERGTAGIGHNPRKPHSLNSTSRSGRTGNVDINVDNHSFTVATEGSASSLMDAAMLPFTKLVRLGLRQVPPAPPAHSPRGNDANDKKKVTKPSTQYFYSSNPSCVYRSFQTLLNVMDEEVVQERKPGEEANIHRASKYISAQQKLANALPSQRLPVEDDQENVAASMGGDGNLSSPPKRKQPLPYGAVSLEDMLRDELRPECVREALEKGASSAMASAQSIFQKHDVRPLTTQERLTIVLDQGDAKAAAMVRPFSARRRTAPVADIASATSQRTIAKHARRLQQEQDSTRSTAERSLEKQSVHLMREYHLALAPRVPTIAGQSPEDAEILRLQLLRSNEQLLRVLRHKCFLFLKGDLRLALVQCSTAAGKDLKTLQRMHQRFRRAGLVLSDEDDDDDDEGEVEQGDSYLDESRSVHL